MGYTDYQFVKIPTFGWYAYNKDRTVVSNIFDVVGIREREFLYSLITKDMAEFLDFDLAFSSTAEQLLKSNLFQVQLWASAYTFARKEIQTYKTTYKGSKVLLKDVLAANGMNHLISNNVGIVTSELLEKYNMLSWPKKDIRGKLLIPTFCTPYHICSLEYAPWHNPNDLQPLWLNDEKGWYGNIQHNKIVSDIKELATTPGNTWDYKSDYWYGNHIVKMSEFLNVSDCMRIWTESQHTTFETSPLQHIIDLGKIDELKNNVARLNYNQLQEIEKLTGEKLTTYWKKARELHVQIGDRVFAKRDNCYYVYKKGNLQQVTNFVIDVDKIVKRGNKFFRTGIIHFGSQAIPFDMDEKFFTTNYRFHRGLKDKFLTAGIGVPIIHPDFFNRALLIIDSFNAGVKIVTDEN